MLHWLWTAAASRQLSWLSNCFVSFLSFLQFNSFSIKFISLSNSSLESNRLLKAPFCTLSRVQRNDVVSLHSFWLFSPLVSVVGELTYKCRCIQFSNYIVYKQCHDLTERVSYAELSLITLSFQAQDWCFRVFNFYPPTPCYTDILTQQQQPQCWLYTCRVVLLWPVSMLFLRQRPN